MSKERVFTFDAGAEIDRYFHEDSQSNGGKPRIVILLGGPASGKTTLRKQRYATGYVVVDAAEIFRNLSQGEALRFPEALQEPLEIIGQMVANRAVRERRHIVTELIGAEVGPVKELIDDLLARGYEVDIKGVFCDVDEAVKRNANRGENDISAYHAEAFQRRWLLKAARARGEE